MPPELIPIAFLALLGAGAAFWLIRAKYRGPAFAPANEREEQLALRLARTLQCRPAQALPAVQRELAMAPDQPDGTILKRAAYHYRQDIPDAPCRVYRDPTRG